MYMVLCLLLLLFKFPYAIIAEVYSLMHFRFSVCKAFDSGLRSPIYIHRNSKGGNQRDCDDDEASSPLRTRSFPVRKWAGGHPHIDRSHYFAITTSWHIFGSVALVSWRLKLWRLCVCVHECRRVWERNSIAEPFAFVSQGERCTLIFWGCVAPGCPPQKAEGTRRLCFNHKWDGHNW